MVQEFHVLRCFSCNTFQVQQVIKSKKWSCKMCGEKQSLVKEYGRGTGADCRRHVQKLNSLRGELLEVETQRARPQRQQEEECEVGDEMRSGQREGQTAFVSRWSKYVDQREKGPESEEDAHDERERVYTDTDSCRQQNNVRKRKKSFNSRVTYRRYTVEEDQDKDSVHGGTARQPSRPGGHGDTFESSLQVPRYSTEFQPASIRRRTDALCASPAASLDPESINAHGDVCSQFTGASSESSTRPQHAVALSTLSAPSFSRQRPSETKPEAKGSKWARFLPSVRVEDGNEEGDGEHAQCLYEDHAALVQSSVMHVARVLPNNTGSTGTGRMEGALLDTACGVEKVPLRPVGLREPVCVQPLTMGKPAFSFTTLFHTDEDFDDTY